MGPHTWNLLDLGTTSQLGLIALLVVLVTYIKPGKKSINRVIRPIMISYHAHLPPSSLPRYPLASLASCFM